MTQTTNYNIDKPEANDALSVLVTFNGDMDIIDAAIKGVDDTATTASATATAAVSAAATAQSAAETAQSTATDAASAASSAADAASAAQSTADAKAAIDDTAAATTTTYSSEKIEEELDTKQTTITGAATTITDSNLTTSRALVSNSVGKVAASDITSTELGYLNGLTTNVQAKFTVNQRSLSPVNGSSLYAVMYRVGNIVTFNYNWTGPMNGTVAFQIPSHLVPITTVLHVPASVTNKGDYVAHIESGGNVFFAGGDTTNVTVYGCVTYIIADS